MRETNPILALIAQEGIAALYRSLPLVAKHPGDPDARAVALYGAWLCALCLGQGGVALHHKLCHVLGGLFDLPHAQTHAIILPHVLAYNAPAIPDAISLIKKAVGRDQPAAALFELTQSVGAPTALRDIGMPNDGIGRAIEAAMTAPYWNPRVLQPEILRRSDLTMLGRVFALLAPTTKTSDWGSCNKATALAAVAADCRLAEQPEKHCPSSQRAVVA